MKQQKDRGGDAEAQIEMEFEADVLQGIAKGIDGTLNMGKTGEDRTTGFCLLVFGMGRAGVSNYVTNAKREDVIKALGDTVERLKAE